MKITIDMSSFEAIWASMTCFFINNSDNLFTEYISSRERENISAKDFAEYIGDTQYRSKEISLTSQHVTTNDDDCDYIKKNGIIPLQRAITMDTPLRRFLAYNGVEIDVEAGSISAKGRTFKMNKQATGGSHDLLEHVAFKLYKDHTVCGFFCSPDVLAYGGRVNRRPEILNNIANAMDMPNLVEAWEQTTKTHIVTYACPIEKYTHPSNAEMVGNMLLLVAYDTLVYGEPTETYSFLKDFEMVDPGEIIGISTVTKR